ncbi:2-oxo acid dehydrogenase subunit E2, partial [Candidatus Woesearchaeota archaeon]|nr:2-oxo acid dehydrogenase subunit E2 [Candidatus Woesearchaeota archaeon]
QEKEKYRKKGIHATVTPYFIKAIVEALKKHPSANASVDDEKQEIILKKYYNIGVAVDTPSGLMVPVLKDADKKSIEQIAKDVAELGEKAKSRKLSLADFKGGTFTLSNLGAIGSTYATPILNYPEAAILVTGKVSDKAVVRDGKIVARKILPLSFTFDHRVLDGAEGARFLADLKSCLEDINNLKNIACFI